MNRAAFLLPFTQLLCLLPSGLVHWLVGKMAGNVSLAPYPGWRLGSGEGGWSPVAVTMQIVWRCLELKGQQELVRWRDNLSLTLYPGNEVSRSIFLTGRYEPNSFSLLDRILKPGMVFLDVGANMGLYALFAAKRVGKEGLVVAIEPSERDFQRLKANIEVNALTNVRPIQAAISNYHGKAELLIATQEKSGHNTLGTFCYESVRLQEKQKVRVERLDDIMQQEKIEHIDVIKMDIEGAEFFALQGAKEVIQRFHPVILLELSDRSLRLQGCNSQQVWELLTENNYCIFGFDQKTGLPGLAQKKAYFDSEDIVAVTGEQLPW